LQGDLPDISELKQVKCLIHESCRCSELSRSQINKNTCTKNYDSYILSMKSLNFLFCESKCSFSLICSHSFLTKVLLSGIISSSILIGQKWLQYKGLSPTSLAIKKKINCHERSLRRYSPDTIPLVCNTCCKRNEHLML
jgi:hypothetical protein